MLVDKKRVLMIRTATAHVFFEPLEIFKVLELLGLHPEGENFETFEFYNGKQKELNKNDKRFLYRQATNGKYRPARNLTEIRQKLNKS